MMIRSYLKTWKHPKAKIEDNLENLKISLIDANDVLNVLKNKEISQTLEPS